jgi:hypothetical protein
MGQRIYIGITGSMQSGKDTLAKEIASALPDDDWVDWSYHFADPLKDATLALLGGTRKNHWGSNEDKNQPTGFAEDLGPAFATFRTSHQFIGTEVFRAVHPDFWVILAKHRIDDYLDTRVEPEDDLLVLFPDVRFDNEAKFIRSRGGIIVRVWRADGQVISEGLPGHASEAGISEDLVTHRFAIGPNGHASVARIVLDAAGVKP